MDVLAVSIVTEQGKTFADAKGDVLRGLQLVHNSSTVPDSGVTLTQWFKGV